MENVCRLDTMLGKNIASLFCAIIQEHMILLTRKGIMNVFGAGGGILNTKGICIGFVIISVL